jgi:ubiquinone/menaquinone biosynthesis C-methylase UbiE
MRESLVASGVAPGETILDYACGPGHFTIEAARMVGPSGHVHAIDREPLAIEMVRRRARDAGVTNVTAAVSACPTGLADHSVDRVLLYDAIAGIDDKRAVLAELDRVLVPDGVLSIWVEHGPPEATVPLITANSRFVLRERIGDILDFGRREAEPDPGAGSTA